MAAANSTGSAQKHVPGRPFPKGESGNPSGRPKVIAEVRDAAREHTSTGLDTLTSIANDKTAPAAARVSAAIAILDRGWGKPAQSITGPGGTPLMPPVITFTRDED